MTENKFFIFLLTLCGILFCACEKDPGFVSQKESVEINTFINNVGYTHANIYCQVVTNGTVSNVTLEFSDEQSLHWADMIKMQKTTNFPKESNFDKSLDVYSTQLVDLKNDKKYFLRIKVTSNIGEVYEKSDISFTTNSFSTTITTKPATDIAYTYATLNGEVVDVDDLLITETGFYYSQDDNMINAKSCKGNKYYGSFKAQVYDLEPNNIYYFQAYAKINDLIYKGEILHFRTDQYVLPNVNTGSFTNLTFNSVDCAITILETGNSTITEWGILYGKESNLDISNAMKVSYKYSPPIQEEFNISITNIEGNTVYFYRAFATNTAGTAYGKEWFFWTDDSPDIQIETLEASLIGYKSARANYSIHTYGQNVIEYGVIYDEYTYGSTLEYEDNHPIKKVSVTNWIGQEKQINSYFSLSQLKEGTEYQYRAYIIYKERWGDISILYGDYEYFDTEYKE